MTFGRSSVKCLGCTDVGRHPTAIIYAKCPKSFGLVQGIRDSSIVVYHRLQMKSTTNGWTSFGSPRSSTSVSTHGFLLYVFPLRSMLFVNDRNASRYEHHSNSGDLTRGRSEKLLGPRAHDKTTGQANSTPDIYSLEGLVRLKGWGVVSEIVLLGRSNERLGS